MLFDFFQSGIYLFREFHENRWNPVGVEGDLLLFFRDFKRAIDSKDIQRLKRLISDDYYSHSYVNQNKQQLLSWVQNFLIKLPFFINPSLEIEICTVPQVKEEQKIYVVIRPIMNLHVLGMNLTSQLFGTNNQIALLLKKDKKYGLFSILNMEEVA
ncbi:MAG: hypothetical protein SAK29_31535 [Scytonema sp. PMC 1069.18]|nr:hypothetical protein [Scytonema sp. PMC 1069.18]MEC4881195.1 hypothetical protein [Scytonema sp. PMC 1070.18]